MPSIYVKPRPRDPKKPDEGVLQVRRESGKPIPPEGAQVELTPYIRRRLRDGDLVEAKAPPRASEKPSRAKSTAKAEQAGDQEA